MKTAVTELLNIEYPMFQGGMAWVAEHTLAAAVSNAGGLGIIASGGASCEFVRKEVRQTKAFTDKPFGVNIMLMNPEAEAIAKMVVDEGVPVVTTGAGNPEKYFPMWKETGIKIIPVVASVGLARRMEEYGADALIAEGCESGGHIGEQTTMSLVPQVVQTVNIPVLAAGGIGDGRGGERRGRRIRRPCGGSHYHGAGAPGVRRHGSAGFSSGRHRRRPGCCGGFYAWCGRCSGWYPFPSG